MINQEQINQVINTIVTNVSPKKIILFGSYAHGNANEDSDLDILVIKDTNEDRYKRSREIRKYLRGFKMPIDIIVYTEKEIEEWKGIQTAFITQILEKGKLVYGQETAISKGMDH